MRKWMTGLLVFALLWTITACGVSPTAIGGSTRSFTDGLGRQVEIPTDPQRIIALGSTPRLAVYLGLEDRFVGVAQCEVDREAIQPYAYVHQEAWSQLPIVGTDAGGEAVFYAEEILLLQPDLIVCSYAADLADNLQQQTGVPVISVSEGSLFSEQYNAALRLLGDACGVSQRAEEVITFVAACVSDLQNRTEAIDDSDKPTVLGAGATFKGSHSIDGVYTSYPVFEILHAKDVADEIADNGNSNGVLVDKEQILAWNPEIIFFDAKSMDLVRTDYAENPGYFAQLQAVQNGQMYQWPNSTWHWSNLELPLVSAYYVGAILYPEAFSDVDFADKAGDIFEFFLGQRDFLSQLEASGYGYGLVDLEG